MYHSVTIDLYYKCDDCGERVRETQQGNNAKHWFNSRGVCKDCGYEEEVEEDCSHKNLSLEYDPQYSYEAIDDVYHSVTVDLYYKCDDCGERVHKTQDSGSVKHHFEYGECVQCHYKELWTEAPILEPTPRPSLMPIETDIPQPTEVVTPVPTAVPTQVITPAPTNTVAPKPTEIATIEPTATVHVCKAGKPSHWYGVYEYYDENSHTRHHVTTTYCTVCGKELSKTNELEYVEHVFENGTCTKCGARKVSSQDVEYATKRKDQLLDYAKLVSTAIERGDILYSDISSVGDTIYDKIRKLCEVENGTRQLGTIVEQEETTTYKIYEATTILKGLDFVKDFNGPEAIAYYQIVNGLEVTGYITEETYNSLMKTVDRQGYLESVEEDCKALSTKQLLEEIATGILRIQENSGDEAACEDIYDEIEVCVRLLKQKPEYVKDKNLKDIDWFVAVDENTPGFKELVDRAFTRQNIYTNAYGSEVRDYLKQYNGRVVINCLTVVDGAIILVTGGVIAAEIAKTGTLTLTVGSTAVAPAGYTASQWGDEVIRAMQKIDSNRANYHFLLEKHNWGKLVSSPTWAKISMYVQEVMTYGEFYTDRYGHPGKRLIIEGYTIEVRYNIVEGVLKIVDGWVANK